MRHFEDYEIEHLLNSTGSFLLRLRCRTHLKHCAVCQQRLVKLRSDMTLIEELRSGISRLDTASQGKPDPNERSGSRHGGN